jgi:flavin reductase (DIM6/NTAB) family NADH-FMN oxidoreductase RutF
MTGIGRQEFTSIMGAFPTGVVVVTTADRQGMPHGITLNSICSVSVTPPLLLICVAYTSRTLGILQERRRFTVNFLASGSGRIAQIFASKREEKFDCVDWRLSQNGIPILHNDIVAFAECEIFTETAAGDHCVILGEVHAGKGPSKNDQPLLYYQRQYDQWPARVEDKQEMVS